MLSFRHCREILGKGCSLSKAELELLRDQLYALAEVVTEEFPKRVQGRQKPRTGEGKPEGRRKGSELGIITQSFQDLFGLIPEIERDDVEERAAIMEFDGGLDRAEAERRAVCNFLKRRRRDDCHTPQKSEW